MADFNFQIVTSQETVFNEPVTCVTMPGEGGYFGVLAHHAPIVSVLKEGNVTIRRGSSEEQVHISSGFFEMSNNRATMLADSLEGLDKLTVKK